MGYPNKIVTCCYCGTRAALVLTGKTRHELACSSCGAPLHDLKMLPKDRSGDGELFDGPRKPLTCSKTFWTEQTHSQYLYQLRGKPLTVNPPFTFLRHSLGSFG